MRAPSLLVFFVAFALVACAPRVGTPALGVEPIDFSLARHGGGTYHLAEDRGQVVLIDVWATWCEPCRETLPVIQAMAQKYAGKGVRVYALNVDTDSRRIAPYLREAQLTLPVLLDPEAEVVEHVLGGREMPSSFLIDQRGMIRQVHQGVTQNLSARLDAELAPLLADSAR